MSATSAVSERSFSAARCIKIYLRSARMFQQHLNHLTLLKSIRTVPMAYINVVDVVNNVAGNNHRKHVFGTKLDSLIK